MGLGGPLCSAVPGGDTCPLPEELLVGATSVSLLDRMCSQNGDWLFVVQRNVSSSGTEEKFADGAFSILQLFCQG